MRTLGALATDSFVRITKLSNGFVVHYQKASLVKRANPIFRTFLEGNAMGMQDKLNHLLDKAMNKIGEGDEWKEKEKAVASNEPPKYIDMYVLEERAIACLTEAEVSKTFSDAVKAQAEIEQLHAEGKFGSSVGVGDTAFISGSPE